MTNVNELLSKMKILAEQAKKSINTEQVTNNKALDFSNLLKDQLNKVNTTLIENDKMAEKLAMGDKSVSLVQAMTHMVKADISMQFVVSARDKLLGAYRDIMNMPL